MKNNKATMTEGEFFAEINISHQQMMIKDSISAEQILEDEIARYLAVLPNGTRVVSKTRCTITGLSIPYEIVFNNPIMNDFKRVELNYVRCAVPLGDKIEQFKLLVSVTYTKKDGTAIP